MPHTCLFKQEFKLYHEAHQSHLKYLVNVPQGIDQLLVRFSYGPLLETNEPALRRSLDKEGLFEDSSQNHRGFRNLLTLTLLDPEKFRGAHHYFNPYQEIIISEEQASLGFLKGQITPGMWEITISNHGIFSDEVEGKLEIFADHSQDLPLRPYPLSAIAYDTKPFKNRDRDYTNPLEDHTIELHSHTNHSDASQSTLELLESAQVLDLDWLAITDHNTTSALYEAFEMDSGRLNLSILPGMEFTTFYGHFLVYGSLELLSMDWTQVNLSNVELFFNDLKNQGALITIAHPYDMGNPYCTGCRFDYPIQNYNFIDTIEVWNEPDPLTNAKNIHAFELWKTILASGIEMNASYGRDWHRPTEAQTLPITHILTVTHPTREDILSSLNLGRTYITCRPIIDWRVNSHYHIGDRIKSDDHLWHHQVSMDHLLPGDKILVWNEYEILKVIEVKDKGLNNYEFTTLNNDFHLIRIEILNQAEEIILFTNPIYKQNK